MKNIDLRIVFVHHDSVFYYNKSTLRLQYSFFRINKRFLENDNVEMTLCLKINVNINKLKTLARSFYLDTVLMKFIKGVLTFFLS